MFYGEKNYKQIITFKFTQYFITSKITSKLLTGSGGVFLLISKALYVSAVHNGFGSGTLYSSGATSPYVALSSNCGASGGTF